MHHKKRKNNFCPGLLLIALLQLAFYTVNAQEVVDSGEVSINRQSYFKDSLPAPIGYVSDFENLYSNSEKQYLDSVLYAFYKRTTVQITIVTIDTTMTTANNLDDYTLRLANKWGVGQKEKNNGIVIGISKAYRRMRIQNGYGIEAILSDEKTSEVIQKAFIPEFRKGDYYMGTLNGIHLLITILQENLSPAGKN